MSKKNSLANQHLEDVDIMIVGGGPSGSSTALHLEQLNPELARRVVVLEKHKHPRDKICGGALTLNAERIIADLGLDMDICRSPFLAAAIWTERSFRRSRTAAFARSRKYASARSSGTPIICKS